MNIGSAFKSGLAGAGTGGIFGPWGALIGGGIGMGGDLLSQLMGGASNANNEFFTGRPAGIASANRFNQGQQNLMSQLGMMGLEGMQNPYAGFAPIRDEAMNQFKTSTIPTIMERFSALGNNALSSPSLGTQLSAGAVDLNKALAAMQSQYGMQNRNQMMQMLGLSLTPQFDNFQTQQQPGLLQQILPSLGTIGTNFAGNYLGGMSGKDALAKSLLSLAN